MSSVDSELLVRLQWDTLYVFAISILTCYHQGHVHYHKNRYRTNGNENDRNNMYRTLKDLQIYLADFPYPYTISRL